MCDRPAVEEVRQLAAIATELKNIQLARDGIKPTRDSFRTGLSDVGSSSGAC